jgi:acyl-CoA thioesterase-1
MRDRDGATFICTSPALSQEKQFKIVAFGGSSTYGHLLEQRSQAYPAKLEAALKTKGVNATVVNAGISGDTTVGGLARLDKDVPAGTDIVILELGINDAAQGIGVPATRANLQKIIDTVRVRGARVLLIGYRGSESWIVPFAQSLKVRGMGFNFPDNGNGKYRLANDPQLRTKGFAHFNASGYDKIVETMLPHILTMIENIKKAN